MSSDSSKQAIMVVGATGLQGGAVIAALEQAGAFATHTVLALTRNTNSATAKAVAKRGAIPVQGDLSDCAVLFKHASEALDGGKVSAVFGVQTVSKHEEAQGKALIDAAVAAGVQHFVYTSVDRGGETRSPRNVTPVPHFASKHRIEQHLRLTCRDSPMTWTILRPVAFMENLTPSTGFNGKVMATGWSIMLRDKPLQLVAVQDIGWFAAQALLSPNEFESRSISIAGDEIIFAHANAVFKKCIGFDMPQTSPMLTRAILWLAGDIGAMIRWFAAEGYDADIAALRAEHPKLQRFDDWLKESDWSRVAS